MWPPQEFYPAGTVLWVLKKAMYGLRTSPQDWQTHFADSLQDMGFSRLQSEANIYVKKDSQIYILVYVDDLLIIGKKDLIPKTVELLRCKFLLKITGQLDSEGSKASFLGRKLHRVSDGILMTTGENYYDSEIKAFSLSRRPSL